MREILLLESLTGKRVRLAEASLEDLEGKGLSRGNHYLLRPNERPFFLKMFIDFDVNNDNLTKSEYNKIKETLAGIDWESTPGRLDIRDLAKEAGMSVNEYTTQNGTRVTATDRGQSYQTTIMDMMNWGTKLLKSHINAMNPLEKRIYDSWFIPNPDAELRGLVNDKFKVMKDRIAIKEPASVSRERERNAQKGALNPNLRTVIDKIGEEFRIVIEEMEYNYYIEIAKDYLKSFPNGTPTPEEYTQKFRVINRGYKQWTDGAIQNSGMLDRDRKLNPRYEEVARKKAFDISTMRIQEFVNKMYDKLGGFLKELGEDFEVNYTGRGSSNNIYFTFPNNSKFSIRNQVVQKYRDGNFFYAYPTTFHDAKVNGVEVRQPSEYSIKAAFTAAQQ